MNNAGYRSPETLEAVAVPNDAGGGDSLYRDLAATIWRRKWSIVGLIVIALAAAAAYLSKQEPVYRSTARVHLGKQGTRIFNDFDAMVGGQQEAYLNVQAQVVKSLPVVRQALWDLESKNNNNAEGKKLSLPASVEEFKGLITVEVGRADETLVISVESGQPVAAAELTNALVNSYVQERTTGEKRATMQSITTLKNLQVEREKDLARKMEALGNFRKENFTMSFDQEKGNIVIERLGTLSSELTKAEVATIEARGLFEAAESLKDNPYNIQRLVDTGPASLAGLDLTVDAAVLRRELRLREQQLTEMLQTTGPSNTTVTRLQAAVREMSQQLEEGEKKAALAIVDVLKQQYERAMKREAELRQEFTKQQKEAVDLNSKRADFITLEMNVKRLQDVVDKVEKRIEELALQAETTAPLITVLEEAVSNTTPARPQRTRTFALAGVLGLMLGLGCGFLQDWVDQRLHTMTDVMPSLRGVVLGFVPRVGRKVGLLVDAAENSRGAEAFRLLSAAVRLSEPQRTGRVLLVTSPGEGEGKSFVCANLAAAMGEAGQSTLVIDADLRRGVQHQLFDVENNAGVVAVLGREKSWADMVRPTAQKNVSLLSAGDGTGPALEQMNVDEFNSLLMELKERYQYVVVDTPPVTVAAESVLMSAAADLTLLVLRMHRTTRGSVNEAMRLLDTAGEGNVAVVVNDVEAGGGELGYGRPRRARKLAGNGSRLLRAPGRRGRGSRAESY